MKRLIFLILILFYSNAHGWGKVGHKIVADVAEANLTPKAREEVAKLLPNLTLADVAIWADLVRYSREYAHTAPWHYADVPDGETYETSDHHSAGDVVVALERQIEILRSKKTPAGDRIEALKFIVHFMGDIHQPLHIGRPEDRGGNTVKVVYNGRTTNLHSLWDSGFIDDLVRGGDLLGQGGQFSKGQHRVLKDFTLIGITNEALALRNDVYSFKGNIIDAKYARMARGIVAKRLQLGGARLAVILNSALD